MKVDNVEFEILAEPPIPEWVLRVTATGSGFVNRAVPLGGRVGALPIEGMVIDLDGNGFTGFLRSEPPNGAHLFVGYLERELEDTGLTYQRAIA